MSTRSESLVTVGGKPSKAVELLRTRLRQLLRVVVVVAACVAVAAAALAIWWLNSLNGLPDIGDPFDVSAFRAFGLPDEQNAFTYLRRASEKLTPIVGMVGGNGADPGDFKFSWSIANPTLREWAGENREAFELFQQGAEQADAANPAGDPKDNRFIDGRLIMLALLEATRREESGDTAAPGTVIARSSARSPTSGGGEARASVGKPRRRAARCSDGSPIGRRGRGPRSPNFARRWKSCSRTSRSRSGISLRLSMGISNSWARWSSRYRFLLWRGSKGNGHSDSAICRFRPRWWVNSRPRDGSSGASPNGAARPAAALCQLPGDVETRGASRRNQPSGRYSLI